MARTVGIGKQNFEDIITKDIFYIDKTMFIKEWWENEDDVTVITRPRRFGKTLNMSMLEQFFSIGQIPCRRLQVPAVKRNLPGHQPFFCSGKGNLFFKRQKENMPDRQRFVQQA